MAEKTQKVKHSYSAIQLARCMGRPTKEYCRKCRRPTVHYLGDHVEGGGEYSCCVEHRRKTIERDLLKWGYLFRGMAFVNGRIYGKRGPGHRFSQRTWERMIEEKP